MAMQLACPGCGKLYRVPDSYAGRHIDCRACGTVFQAALPVATAIPIEDAPPHPSPPQGRGAGVRGRSGSGMSQGLFWGLVGGGIGVAVLIVLVVVVIVVQSETGRANPENFQRVRQGMTEQEVIAIMGPPTRRVDLGLAASLVWSTPTHEFVVSIFNNQVAMAAALPHNANQPGINFGNFPNVNVGNVNVNMPNVGGGRDWNQLKVGMTEKQVTDQFGAPALSMDCDGKLVFAGVTENEIRAAHNGQLPHVTVLTYMDIGLMAHIKVTVVDGKVFKVRKL